MIANYLVGIIPIFLYILVLKSLDSFAVAKPSILAKSILCGLASCLVAFILARTIGWSADYISPILEESLKALFIIYLVNRRRIRFLAEGLIYGAAIGGGFSILENTIYVLYCPTMDFGTAMFRGVGVAIMHMGCTGIMACLLILTCQKMKMLNAVAMSIVPSIIIHLAHNIIDIEPSYRLFGTVILFLILFYVIMTIGESLIYKWMDHSISEDIYTLAAIRQGNFSATKSGQYLMHVKEQFQPEVFFDMICLVQLHLELKLEKQSRMLKAQAGFKDDRTEEELAAHNAQVAEIDHLFTQIGKTAKWVLRPLLR